MKTYYYNNKNYIKLYNCDCLDLMQHLINRGMQVDAIITDPPYGYLDHKLDKKFDNHKFFELAYKLIKQNGFLIFFGRGVENAKRIVIADEVGFKFKEEIVWNKKHTSSQSLPIGRLHEMAYMFTKDNGKINYIYKDFDDEIYKYDNESYIKILENDIKRLISYINNVKNYNDFINLKEGNIKIKGISKYNLTSIPLNNYNGFYKLNKKYNYGALIKSIINLSNDVRYNHTQIHPTEKPVKLLQILIELVDNGADNYTILDPFAGSCSQAMACYNLNKNFIGCEIDKEYYDLAVNRIYKECKLKLF